MPPPPPIPSSLLPPPRSSLTLWLRRASRSRKALSGTTQLLIDWGIPILALVAAFLLYCTLRRGWNKSYQVLLTIEPPTSIDLPIAPWVLSIVGWAAIPALVGGFAGHVITRISDARKALSSNALFKKRGLRRRLSSPRRITWLGVYVTSVFGDRFFVDVFVRLAHLNDWRVAQDHWEIAVRDVVSTSQFKNFDRIEAMQLAESSAKLFLIQAALVGICPVCQARNS